MVISNLHTRCEMFGGPGKQRHRHRVAARGVRAWVGVRGGLQRAPPYCTESRLRDEMGARVVMCQRTWLRPRHTRRRGQARELEVVPTQA